MVHPKKQNIKEDILKNFSSVFVYTMGFFAYKWPQNWVLLINTLVTLPLPLKPNHTTKPVPNFTCTPAQKQKKCLAIQHEYIVTVVVSLQ